MIKKQIEQLILSSLDKLQQTDQMDVAIPAIQIEKTKDKQHGDFASNIALVLSKSAKRSPRELAESIVKAMPQVDAISNVTIAGPGFINFYLASDALYSVIPLILEQANHFGRSDVGKHKRILLEFISSNPTGPLHVGHGRHAAYGAVVAELLKTVGYDVHREYYVNDAGRQVDILAVSVWLRYLNLVGELVIFPTNAYKGDYIVDIAQTLQSQYGERFRFPVAEIIHDLPPDEPNGGDKEIYIDSLIARAKILLGENNFDLIRDIALENILKDIHDDLVDFGVHFETWFSERELLKSDVVDRMIQTLQNQGLVYEKEGALWFQSTTFQDEKDRVLQRSNGQRTYFTNDLAYHLTKFQRASDHAINIFGSDHHGYVPRMKAGLEALGIPRDKLTYLLMQFVSLYRNGEPVKMSTRSGSFVTLRELRNEVGNDAARFFYVMRKCEQPVDFDLDLAKSKTNENPVYYIQYAYARICSVFRQLADKKIFYSQEEGLQHLALLKEQHEIDLISTLSRYPDVILNAANNYEPHLLTNYLRDLANHFHGYYNAHQFLVDDSALRNARLALISATRQVLANGLTLLGVSTPESM